MSEYTGISMFEVMEKRLAVEILGIVQIMQAKEEMLNLRGKNIN